MLMYENKYKDQWMHFLENCHFSLFLKTDRTLSMKPAVKYKTLQQKTNTETVQLEREKKIKVSIF